MPVEEFNYKSHPDSRITEADIENWQRTLHILRQENVSLKFSLSNFVDARVEADSLQVAEYFQNELVAVDGLIDTLLKKIHIIISERDKNHGPLKPASTRALYEEVRKLEKRFAELNRSFHAQIDKADP